MGCYPPGLDADDEAAKSERTGGTEGRMRIGAGILVLACATAWACGDGSPNGPGTDPGTAGDADVSLADNALVYSATNA